MVCPTVMQRHYHDFRICNGFGRFAKCDVDFAAPTRVLAREISHHISHVFQRRRAGESVETPRAICVGLESARQLLLTHGENRRETTGYAGGLLDSLRLIAEIRLWRTKFAFVTACLAS